jgi:large subunit ribosomal protein L9
MELILTKDIENLGFKDDVVIVKNGYGRNFLIPRGFAILATESAKKVLAENLRQRAHKEAQIIDNAKKLAEKLQDVKLSIEVLAGQDGKLFGSITNLMLANALQDKGIELDRKYIQITTAVKAVGTYVAKIRLHREVNVEISFDVVAKAKK